MKKAGIFLREKKVHSSIQFFMLYPKMYYGSLRVAGNIHGAPYELHITVY